VAATAATVPITPRSTKPKTIDPRNQPNVIPMVFAGPRG
jgi:hypothetical protein